MNYAAARTLSHQWRDRKPFSRRVRWYAAGLLGDDRNVNIRLEFTDQTGTANRFYRNDHTRATADWEAFRNGTLTVADVIATASPEGKAWHTERQSRRAEKYAAIAAAETDLEDE